MRWIGMAVLLGACEPRTPAVPVTVTPTPAQPDTPAHTPVPAVALTEPPAAPDLPADSSTATALNRFAFGLYKGTRPSTNRVLSPWSVASALAMLELGASGEAGVAVRRVLGVEEPERFRKDFSRYGKAFTAGEPEDHWGTEVVPHRITLANALWVDQRLPLHEAYLKRAEETYRAVARPMDVERPEAAAEAVNAWASEHTQGRIPSLIGPRTIHPLTRLIVANAVHFHARWQEPFQEDNTSDRVFYADGKTPVTVPMMHNEHKFESAEDELVRIVELPYWSTTKGVQMVMTLVLPKARDGLSAVEEKLGTGWLPSLLSSLRVRMRVKVSLPRWKTESSMVLDDALRGLGGAPLFVKGRDYAAIAEGDLGVDTVVHKTFMSVDEKGTEAAAATVIRTAGAGMMPDPMVFNADHPFLYLIREKHSGLILFVGRVDDPSQ